MKNKSQPRIGSNYSVGKFSYEENNILYQELDPILKIKNPRKKLERLIQLRSCYSSPLTRSNIDYYLEKTQKELTNKGFTILFLLFVTLYLFFTFGKISDVYQKHTISVSNDSLNTAVASYNSGDYDSALLYLEKLYTNGWHDLTTIHYLVSSYEAKGNYNAAAEVLLRYLTDYLGIYNITTENSIYSHLRTLYIDSMFKPGIITPVSDTLSNRIDEASDTVMNCSWTYAQIRNCIRDENYVEAEDLCKTLASMGANGFYYTAYYSNVLINTGRYIEAYKLVMDTVRDDLNPHRKMIPAIQRKSLVNYIIPYLDENEVADCNDFLFNEVNTLNIISDSEITEPYIYYDDVESTFKYHSNFNDLNLLELTDTVIVDNSTTFLNGDECYYIKLNHYNAGNSLPYYFLMDMSQSVYIFIDGKYVLLPTDELSDPPENGYQIPTRHLVNKSHPEISMTVNFDEAGKALYSIYNNQTNEVFIKESHLEYSTYDAYSYFKKQDMEFTTFFSSSEEAVLLVTRDSLEKYSFLQGRYITAE